jgi:hypothetical protein
MSQENKESRPISRVLSRAIIPLGPTSPWASSGLPGSARRSGAAVLPPLLPYLALLQVGFAVPCDVATDAVRSYRTLSPLPAPCGASAVYFLLHFPWARAPQALPGTLTRRARTFLHSPCGKQRLPGRLSSAHDTASTRNLQPYRAITPGPARRPALAAPQRAARRSRPHARGSGP